MRSAFAIARLGAFASALLSSAIARASSETLPVSLTYHASPACPSEADFLEELRIRTPRVRAARPSERAYGVLVRIVDESNGVAAEGGRVVGEVELLDLDGRPAVRRLEGSSCLDVARALALVAALDVAGVAFVPPQAAEPVKDGAARPAPAPVGEQVIEPARWFPSVALHAGLRSGVAPTLAASGTLSFVLDRNAPRLASEFRVSASYAAGDTPGARASVLLRLATMALDACVPAVDLLGARMRVMPCARLETGIHMGELQPGLGAKAALWIAPGLVGRIRARAVGPVFVEAEISALFPLVRTRFFEGDAISPVYTSPWLVAAAAVGGGTTFP